MPEISRFFGIIIRIYYNEHNPPHFHVQYEDKKAVFSIDELKLIEGTLHPRVKGLVIEWASLYKEELLEVWNLAQEKAELKKIKGLV